LLAKIYEIQNIQILIQIFKNFGLFLKKMKTKEYFCGVVSTLLNNQARVEKML